MAAETVHLSALEDLASDARVPPGVRRLIATHFDAARTGAILVDLPYYDRFARELMRYVLHLSPTPAPWGDRFHRRAPVAFASALFGEAAQRGSTVLQALALGYLTHVALDSALHPPVNRMVADRLAPLGRLANDEAAQHREIEKYQTVLFHEERYGFDPFGTSALLRHLDVPAGRVLADSKVFAGIAAAAASALRSAPSVALWARWSRGLRAYAFTLASPFGATLVPEARKAWARSTFYSGPAIDYPAAYRAALAAAVSLLEIAEPLLASTPLPERVSGLLRDRVPERSLDYPERAFVAE